MNSVGTVKPTDTLVTLYRFYSYSDTLKEKTTLINIFVHLKNILDCRVFFNCKSTHA